MKKGLLLFASGDSSWIGGVYYIKNITYQLCSNDELTKKFNIYICASSNVKHVFDCFGNKIRMLKLRKNKLIKFFKLILYRLFYKIKYVFPIFSNLSYIGIQSIAWIPDFQHNYLPSLFSQDELRRRTENYTKAAQNKMPLVLSSNSSYDDFYKFYKPISSKEVVMVPFVSYIEPELSLITDELERQVLDSFGLYNKRYVCISNQFWKHKNHIVVFKALAQIVKNNPEFSTTFVFTGKMQDYRDPEYIDVLRKLIEDDNISRICKLVGFVDRIQQLILMKNSEFIIQPSLFEGWGTVVEDAKVLDKDVILSDIPVHREQMNSKCVLFEPTNESDLANKIISALTFEHPYSIKEGIEDMKIRAVEYSKEFENILKL